MQDHPDHNTNIAIVKTTYYYCVFTPCVVIINNNLFFPQIFIGVVLLLYIYLS